MAYDAYYRPLGFQLQQNTTPIWKNGSFANAATPYQYDGAGNILSIGNMMTTALPDAFTYDALSRLTAATVRKGTAQAHAYAYQYDGYGNLTGRADNFPSASPPFTSLYDFLTKPVNQNGCGVGAAEAAEYGKALGFTATTGTGINGPNNRLATVTRGGTLTVGGTAFVTGMTQTSATMAYDGNGNMTDDGTFTYVYDPLNRLVAVKAKTAGTPMVAQYFYDAAGERAAAVAYNAGGTATTFTQTLRNGNEALYEKSWDLPGWTVVNTEKVYLMAGGKMAVTRQTAYGTTTTYTYYGTDHLGTVRSTVTLTSGGVAQPATFHDYEPFGVGIPGAVTYVPPSTHRYTGQERDGLYDPATASTSYLDYMHFRSMGVSMGRFMRPDSVMGNVNNPQSWNLYSYVRGNPVGFMDPTGHIASGGGNRDLGVNSFGDDPYFWENYLWGGGAVSNNVTRFSVTNKNGKVVNWGLLAPGDSVAPSTPSGKGAEEWLANIGVPKDQQAFVLNKLAKEFNSVGMGPELAVAIVVDPNTGKFDVKSSRATGSVGEATTADMKALATKASAAGLQVMALGHAHMPTGSPNFLVDASGRTKVAEGASVADAMGYQTSFVTPAGVPPSCLFSLASVE